MSIRGRLKDMGLVDIVQVFHLQNKTAAIYLSSDLGNGKVYMKDGRVVHAICSDLVGEDALYHIIGWGDGDFEVEANIEPPALTIDGDVEQLLLEGAKRLDEKVRDSAVGGIYRGDIESSQLVKRLVEMGILVRNA